jgi:glycosyltransferase involved in cell wall biosynthesis
MKPLRIGMLAPFGIRPKGTLAVRMLPLAQALVRRGHTAWIVAPPVQNPQDAGQRVVYGGVPVLHTPLPTLPGAAGVLQQVHTLLRLVLADAPDVLHLFKPKGYSGLAALAARLLSPRLPLVVDSDDWEGRGGWNDVLPYPPAAKALFAWQERDLPRRAAVVTVASRSLQTQVWGFGVAPQRVIYLPNGAAVQPEHPPAPRPPHHPPTILLYTRFWEFDVRDVVAVLVAIGQRCPVVRLLVVGKGERGEEQKLLRLAARAGVAPLLDYRGWVEPAQIPALLASADVALVPMDDTLINRARCSVKLLELLAAGLPVVAASVGEVREYISHGESGVLVPPGNVGALAAAVLRLLHDEALRQHLGAGARCAVARFAWDALAPLAEQAYGQALHYQRREPARN